MQDSNLKNILSIIGPRTWICCVEIYFCTWRNVSCRGVKSTVFQPMDCAVQVSHNSVT
jgi:hypothetical protein